MLIGRSKEWPFWLESSYFYYLETSGNCQYMMRMSLLIVNFAPIQLRHANLIYDFIQVFWLRGMMNSHFSGTLMILSALVARIAGDGIS